MQLAFRTSALVLTCAAMWVVVFMLSGHGHEPKSPHAVRLNPDAERRAPYAVLSTPNAERATPSAVKPYVASIRKDSNTYHLRGCTKYGKELKVVVEMTKDEAEASGKQPCSYCIGRAIDTAQQPQSEPPPASLR